MALKAKSGKSEIFYPTTTTKISASKQMEVFFVLQLQVMMCEILTCFFFFKFDGIQTAIAQLSLFRKLESGQL